MGPSGPRTSLRSSGWSCSSAAMKSSLVAALFVVLTVAHGTESVSLVKRDVQAEVDKITKLINDMSTSITSATQELVDKVQAEAIKLQKQVKPYIANIEDKIKPLTNNFNAQVKPLTDNFHAQVKPLTDLMEKFFKQVMDQTKALLPPQ